MNVESNLDENEYQDKSGGEGRDECNDKCTKKLETNVMMLMNVKNVFSLVTKMKIILSLL